MGGPSWRVMHGCPAGVPYLRTRLVQCHTAATLTLVLSRTANLYSNKHLTGSEIVFDLPANDLHGLGLTLLGYVVPNKSG